MSALRTWFDIVGRDQASPAMARVSAGLRGMGAAAHTTGAALGRALSPAIIGGVLTRLGGGIQQVVAGSVKEASELQYALAELKGISNATDAEMSQLAGTARRLGIETQFTPTQALEGLTSLAQQGFTAAQQMAAVESSLLLAGASGGRVPLADAAKLTAQTLKAFQLDSSRAGITIDQLTKTTTMSGLAIDELSEALQNASSGAIAMGLNVKESMAALGLIKNIIPSASMAGSAFQILTQRLSDPRVQGLLQSGVGVDVVDKATGSYRDFGTVLVELSERMMGLTEAERGALIVEAFGARAQKGILSIMAQLHAGVTTTTGEVYKGADAWNYWMKNLDESKVAGFAEELNNLKLDTLNGQLQLLTGSIQTFMGELGKSTAGILKSGIKAFLSVFNRILEVFTALPQPVKTVITGFLATFGTVIKLVGGLMLAKGVLGMLGVSFSGLFATLGKVLLLAGPVTLALGALGIGVYGIFRALKNNIAGAGSSWSDLWTKVKIGWQGVIDLIATGALSKGVMDDLQKAENQGVAKFLRNAMVWIEKAKLFFRGLVAGFDDGLRRLAGPIRVIKESLRELFGGWLDVGREGQASMDKWYSRGMDIGDMLSEFSALLLKGVNLLIRGAIWAKNFFASLTMADLAIKTEGTIKSFQGLLWVIQKSTDAALRLADALLAAQTIGKDTGDLTRGEMMARVGYLQGEEARSELSKRFEMIDELSKLGKYGKGSSAQETHRKAMEAAFVNAARAESPLPWLSVDTAQEMASENVKELGWAQQDSMAEMARELKLWRKMAAGKRKSDIVIDGRRLAEIVQENMTTAEQEGYFVPLSEGPVAAE